MALQIYIILRQCAANILNACSKLHWLKGCSIAYTRLILHSFKWQPHSW